MGKRKLTKEEKNEIKYRASIGRCCKPGCALIVYGFRFSYAQRIQFYKSGINIIFVDELSEIISYFEEADALGIYATAIIRTENCENAEFFKSGVESVLGYIDDTTDVKIYGHTPNDAVLNRFGLRRDDMDDRAFFRMLSRWVPYCKDELNYGLRLEALKKKADEEPRFTPAYSDVMSLDFDLEGLCECLAACVPDEGGASA